MSKNSMPCTINSLMRKMRKNGIAINGSNQKKQLINCGYFHGYKGYRFFNKSSNKIKYNDFESLIIVINYDSKLKELFYSGVMFLETAIKNIVVVETIKDLNDASFDTIYKSKMTDCPNNSKLRLRRMRIRDFIHTKLSKIYGYSDRSNKNSQATIVSHFYNRGDEIPIWALFEIISLGDFAEFIWCLNKDIREEILKYLDIYSSADTDRQLLSTILYTIKSLRNAIAHNNVIFDTRFTDRSPSRSLLAWLNQFTKINNITFNSIVDFLILICVMIYKIDKNNELIPRMINEFEDSINELYNQLDTSIYTKIVSTDTRKKLQLLRKLLQIK